MNLKIPKTWRKGQTLFNFLEWLRIEKKIVGNQNSRLADTFYLSNKDFDKYLKEYNNINK